MDWTLTVRGASVNLGTRSESVIHRIVVFISACVAVYTSPKSMCLIAESRTSASPAFGHSNINVLYLVLV